MFPTESRSSSVGVQKRIPCHNPPCPSVSPRRGPGAVLAVSPSGGAVACVVDTGFRAKFDIGAEGPIYARAVRPLSPVPADFYTNYFLSPPELHGHP